MEEGEEQDQEEEEDEKEEGEEIDSLLEKQGQQWRDAEHIVFEYMSLSGGRR